MKFKMVATGYGKTKFNIGLYGENASKRKSDWTLWEKVVKHFFTETTWTIETKLFRNVHLMDLYKFRFFYADW